MLFLHSHKHAECLLQRTSRQHNRVRFGYEHTTTSNSTAKGTLCLAGGALDTSCGTKLNTDRGILATHPDWHAEVVKAIGWSIDRKAHMQWVEAIIDSGVATPLALQATADNYECANYHEFVPKLRDAALRFKRKLPDERSQQLLRIFSQGSAAINLALSQHSITDAEVDCMLQMSPEAAADLTDRSLVSTTPGEGIVDSSEEEGKEEDAGGRKGKKRVCS